MLTLVPINRVPVRPSEDGALMLNLEEADLENRGYVSSNHAKLIRDEEVEHITWIETRTWLEWPVVLEKETTFEVYATVASVSDSSKVFFQIGEENQVLDLPDTGGLETFMKQKLGKITLPAGKTRLMLKGEREGWQQCNLGNVELRVMK